jgi:D-tyrosyl-tRNA(Tyr) deacylase
MRAVVQRVRSASVTVDGAVVGSIQAGLLVLLGVGRLDLEEDSRCLAEKIAGLRVFSDADGRMNLALADVGGQVLVVSQFTLFGDCRRGRRPSYADAAPAAQAEPLYRHFVACLRTAGLCVVEGAFGARMDVSLINDGPVTLLLDSRRLS